MNSSPGKLKSYLLPLLILALLLGACGGQAGQTPTVGQPTSPSPSPSVASPSPSAAPSASPSASPTPAQAQETPQATQGAASGQWWREAAQKAGCVDQTIRGVTESTPPSKYAADVLAKQFEQATGIKVELETTSWDQMYDKAIKDMEAKTGIYDFVYTEQDIVYGYMARNFLVDLTKMMEENPELKAPTFDLSKFTSFIDYFKDPKTGHLYGVPMESFIKTYVYRKDLFENPEIRAAFKKQYGRDLEPAKNFEEYRQIAEFFTKWGKDHGEQLWGTTVQAASGHPASFYELVETIFPSWGIYNWGINPKTYKATVEHGGQMNSPKAKQALKFWLDMLKYAPPESTNSTWDEVAATFAAGRAAQGWIYGENVAWIATDPSRSKVVGKVGVALPPTAPGVMQDAKSGKGYIGYYDGGAFAIPYSSKKQKCALLWLEYIGQPSVQPEWAAKTARITLTETFDDPLVKQVDKQTGGYFTLMRKYGDLFAGAPPFPFHAQVREVVAPFIYKAISGQMSPDQALDEAAKAAEEEMQRLGYGK